MYILLACAVAYLKRVGAQKPRTQSAELIPPSAEQTEDKFGQKRLCLEYVFYNPGPVSIILSNRFENQSPVFKSD